MLYESYYGIADLGAPFIEHHGIKGMKWGVRRYQNRDGSLTSEGRRRYDHSKILENADTFNLSKWGKDPDHNVLYVTGLSGSGKSTAAINLADKNTDVIHLDFYFEKGSKEEFDRYSNKNLNEYLNKNGIHMEKLWDGSLDKSQNRQERWKLIDAFTEATEQFGRQQYQRGRKVVMEGVQLADQTMYPDKSLLKGKPLAIIKTGRLKSLYRGLERDDIALYDIPTIAIRYKNQTFWHKSIKELTKEMGHTTYNVPTYLLKKKLSTI